VCFIFLLSFLAHKLPHQPKIYKHTPHKWRQYRNFIYKSKQIAKHEMAYFEYFFLAIFPLSSLEIFPCVYVLKELADKMPEK
jgi:hypothetical protein